MYFTTGSVFPWTPYAITIAECNLSPWWLLPYLPYTPTWGQDSWEACGQSHKSSPNTQGLSIQCKTDPWEHEPHQLEARDLLQRPVCVGKQGSQKPLKGPDPALPKHLLTPGTEPAGVKELPQGPAVERMGWSSLVTSPTAEGMEHTHENRGESRCQCTCVSPGVSVAFGSLKPSTPAVCNMRVTPKHHITYILSAQSCKKYTVNSLREHLLSRTTPQASVPGSSWHLAEPMWGRREETQEPGPMSELGPTCMALPPWQLLGTGRIFLKFLGRCFLNQTHKGHRMPQDC